MVELLAQIPVFQKPVLEGKAFFFPLSPLFEVEVNVGALCHRGK